MVESTFVAGVLRCDRTAGRRPTARIRTVRPGNDFFLLWTQPLALSNWRVSDGKAARGGRQQLAGTSLRQSPRKRRLCDTLLTLIVPGSMTTAPAKARILGAEHELPTATVARSSQAAPGRRRGQLCAGGVLTRAWKVGGGSGTEVVARLNRKYWRR